MTADGQTATFDLTAGDTDARFDLRTPQGSARSAIHVTPRVPAKPEVLGSSPSPQAGWSAQISGAGSTSLERRPL